MDLSVHHLMSRGGADKRRYNKPWASFNQFVKRHTVSRVGRLSSWRTERNLRRMALSTAWRSRMFSSTSSLLVLLHMPFCHFFLYSTLPLIVCLLRPQVTSQMSVIMWYEFSTRWTTYGGKYGACLSHSNDICTQANHNYASVDYTSKTTAMATWRNRRLFEQTVHSYEYCLLSLTFPLAGRCMSSWI